MHRIRLHIRADIEMAHHRWMSTWGSDAEVGVWANWSCLQALKGPPKGNRYENQPCAIIPSASDCAQIELSSGPAHSDSTGWKHVFVLIANGLSTYIHTHTVNLSSPIKTVVKLDARVRASARLFNAHIVGDDRVMQSPLCWFLVGLQKCLLCTYLREGIQQEFDFGFSLSPNKKNLHFRTLWVTSQAAMLNSYGCLAKGAEINQQVCSHYL